jgi:hypothetical protein
MDDAFLLIGCLAFAYWISTLGGDDNTPDSYA